MASPIGSFNVVLLIANCKKYSKKREHQRQSWLLHCSIPYYHIIGDTSLETLYRFDDAERILWVKEQDDYVSLPKKMETAFRAVYEQFPEVQYVFKTDDDQHVTNLRFFESLQKTLLQQTRQTQQQQNNLQEQTHLYAYHYGGFIIHISTPQTSEYYKIHSELPTDMVLYPTKYCSGRFYFLSRQALQWIQMHADAMRRELLEDYAVGRCVYPHLAHDKQIMNITTNHYFQDFS